MCKVSGTYGKSVRKVFSKVAETSSLASILHAGWIKRMKYQLHLYKSAAFAKQSEVVHSKALKVGEGYGLELVFENGRKAM